MLVLVYTGVAQGQGGSLAHVGVRQPDSQEFSADNSTLEVKWDFAEYCHVFWKILSHHRKYVIFKIFNFQS